MGSKEKKKRAVLLTVVGPQAYLLLSNLVAPTKPAEKTYAALTKAMLDHLKPNPLIIAERFWFHRRNQTEGEGISQRRTEEASRLLSVRTPLGGGTEGSAGMWHPR